MGNLQASYSHAAPFIREALMRATYNKINAKTQKKRAEYDGQMYAYTNALDILLRSPEGKGSETGYPTWHGTAETAIVIEIERYVGGPHRMIELGFKGAGVAA